MSPSNSSTSGAATFFAVEGNALVVASGGRVGSVNLTQTSASLPDLGPPGIPESDLADADSVYTAYVDSRDVGGDQPVPARVVKTPRAGGTPTVLFEDHRSNPQTGGMADAGDAILLSIGWFESGATGGTREVVQVLRIPKAGGAATPIRPDVPFDMPLRGSWLGWDGANVEALVLLPESVRASVPVRNGPPVAQRMPPLGAAASLSTKDGTLVLENPDGAQRIALMTTAGGHGEGSVLACTSVVDARPLGLAADAAARTSPISLRQTGPAFGPARAREAGRVRSGPTC